MAELNLGDAERLAEEAEELLKGYQDLDVSQARFMRRSFELYPLLASTLLQMVARVRELEAVEKAARESRQHDFESGCRIASERAENHD